VRPIAPVAAVLAAGLLSLGTARAETFHACRGFITSVPTTISTQGVWCMNQDLSSTLASGTLVTVATNNVTIDCNGYKLGGLGAGIGTQTTGIGAVNRLNVTVRGCNLRGFKRPVSLTGSPSAGHSIVDNRIEAATEAGVYVAGTGVEIARNFVVDTGGAPTGLNTWGILLQGDGDVVDNRIDGVLAAGEDGSSSTFAIEVDGASGAVVRGNRLRNVDGGIGMVFGIAVTGGTFASVVDNDLANGNAAEMLAIYCTNQAIVSGNRVYNFGSPLTGCDDDGGNISKN
jgi:hypothetical protein